MENFLSNSFIILVGQSKVSISTILIVLALSCVLGFALSFLYKKTFRGISYSSAFVSSIVLLVVITSVVMLVIGSDLARAFGLVGALSIIRFRTAIKDPKDIAFIFLAMVIGLAVGTQNYHIAIISTFFILFLIYIMHLFNYGSFVNHNYFITIDVKKDEFSNDDLISTFKKYTNYYSLNNINSIYGDGQIDRQVYKITIANKLESDLLSMIKSLKGVKGVAITSAENYISH